jgi:acyl-CoA reductase-like NAD-dependent aldehyde dehydrogenase
MDAGAMCMPGSVEKVQRLIDDAISKGAQVLVGGQPGPANSRQQQTAAAACDAGTNVPNSTAALPPSPARVTRRAAAAAAAAAAAGADEPTGGGLAAIHALGQFYPPTVITGVTKDMNIYYEEVFGPVSAGLAGVFVIAVCSAT